MRKVLNEAAKFSVAVVLGLIYVWFMLSFAWSLDDMSTAEKVAGVIYCFAVMPIYEGIKRLLRLD